MSQSVSIRRDAAATQPPSDVELPPSAKLESQGGRWLARSISTFTVVLALGGVAVWDGQQPWNLQTDAKETLGKIASSRLAFSPDGKYLCVVAAKQAHVYDLTARTKIHTIVPPLEVTKGPGFPSALAFGRDGRSLQICWRSTSGAALITQEDFFDKKTIGDLRPTEKKFVYVNSLVLLKSGRTLTAVGMGTAAPTLWDREMKPIRIFIGHHGGINTLCVSGDERRMVSTGTDGTVRLWDVETGLELFTLGKHSGQSTGVAFSPDGTRIASTGPDGTLRIWSAAPAPTGEVAPPPRLVLPVAK